MGLYTIITRAAGTVLTGFGSTSDIYNVDHVNHVTHTAADFLNSFEATLADMQATTNPYTTAPSLPASLADEFERIRYVIADIMQKLTGVTTAPYWYDAIDDLGASITLPSAAARAEMSLSQGVPSGTFTDLTFDTSIYDTASIKSGNRLKAPVDGVYICGATARFGNGTTTGPAGDFRMRLRHDQPFIGTYFGEASIYSALATPPKSITVEAAFKFLKGEFFAVEIYQDSGAFQATFADATIRPAIWMALVGRV